MSKSHFNLFSNIEETKLNYYDWFSQDPDRFIKSMAEEYLRPFAPTPSQLSQQSSSQSTEFELISEIDQSIDPIDNLLTPKPLPTDLMGTSCHVWRSPQDANFYDSASSQSSVLDGQTSSFGYLSPNQQSISPTKNVTSIVPAFENIQLNSFENQSTQNFQPGPQMPRDSCPPYFQQTSNFQQNKICRHNSFPAYNQPTPYYLQNNQAHLYFPQSLPNIPISMTNYPNQSSSKAFHGGPQFPQNYSQGTYTQNYQSTPEITYFSSSSPIFPIHQQASTMIGSQIRPMKTKNMNSTISKPINGRPVGSKTVRRKRSSNIDLTKLSEAELKEYHRRQEIEAMEKKQKQREASAKCLKRKKKMIDELEMEVEEQIKKRQLLDHKLPQALYHFNKLKKLTNELGLNRRSVSQPAFH